MILLPIGEADKADMLAIVDDLRKAIMDDKIVGFIGVGVEPDDTTRRWQCTTRGVTRLRMMGAVAHLQSCLHNE